MAERRPAPAPELVERHLAVARAAVGRALDAAENALLRENVERLRGAVAILDAFLLENGDEPDASFHVVEGVDRT